jgi:hypothetical protein
VSPVVSEAIASNIFALWAGAQTGPGAPAATADKKLRQVDGQLAIQRDLASVGFGDGRVFANGTDFTNTLVGGGSPVIQAQPGSGAWLIAQAFGQDAFTAGTGTAPSTHVLTPGTSGRWLTFWTTVGQGTVSAKQRFADARIGSLVLSASQAQKDARVTATVIALDPGVIYDTDPVAADDGEDPFLYTQAEGTFNIDARGAGAITTVSEVTLTYTWALAPWYGDSVKPRALIASRGEVTCNFTLLLDDQTLPIYNLIHYGTETPAVGASPMNTVHYGSLDFLLAYGVGDAHRSLRVQVPRIAYRTDVAVAGRVDGGAIEMAVGGMVRYPVGGGPISTITAVSGDDAGYIS